MNRYQLAARVTGRALLLAECQASALSLSIDARASEPRGLVDQVRGFLSGERHSPAELGERVRPVMAASEWVSAAGGGGFVLVGELAVIDIAGVLWDRGLSWWADGLDAYDVIAATIDQARSDERVERILLRISSPGGLVEGLYDLAERIEAGNARNGGKPIIAFAGSYALSAAYAIACCCDRIVAAHEGLVGSIGAIVPHYDDSRRIKDEGIDVSVFRFGAEKAQGDHEPLSDQRRIDLQAQIDRIGEMFVALVDRGRPNMDATAILGTDARVFIADHSDKSQSALALGLVDQVMHESELLTLLAGGELVALGLPAADAPAVPAAPADPVSLAGVSAGLTSSQEGDTHMDKDELLAALTAAEEAGENGEAVIARIRGAIAAQSEVPAEPVAEAGADPVTDHEADATPPAVAPVAGGSVDVAVAEAVMNLPEAAGRDAVAKVLAFTPGMTVERAKASLAKTPKAQGGFPGVVPDPAVAAGNDGGDQSVDAVADRALALVGIKR